MSASTLKEQIRTNQQNLLTLKETFWGPDCLLFLGDPTPHPFHPNQLTSESNRRHPGGEAARVLLMRLMYADATDVMSAHTPQVDNDDDDDDDDTHNDY